MIGRQADRNTSQNRRLPPTPLSIASQMTIRQKTEDQMPSNWSKNRKATNCKDNLEVQHKSRETQRECGVKHSLKEGNAVNIKSRNNLKQTAVKDNCSNNANMTKKRQSAVKDSLFVPEILISHVGNDDEYGQTNTSKNVYVCGNLDNDMWHRLLVDLCREFSVRCISPSEYPECNKWLSKTDVFVFLMDDVSVIEPAFKDQLRMALMLDLYIVYVRDLGFELKTGGKWDGIWKSESVKERSNPEQTDPNIKAEMLITQQVDPDIASLEEGGRRRKSVDEKEDMYLGSVDSATIIHPSNISVIRDNLNSSTKSDYLSSDTYRATLSADECGKVYPGGEIDINEVIESEYGTSLVYHDLYHPKCLERIISSIKSHDPKVISGATSLTRSQHSLMSSTMSLGHRSRSVSCNELSHDGTRPYLHTPALSMFSSVSNDSAVGDMFHRMSPEPYAQEADKQLPVERSFSPNDNSLSSRQFSQSETIYIVSPDSGNEKLRVFHWPEDVEKESIANSPSIDSLGFQDIDLSKRVNEIDLFDGYITD
jgi:hypothetical protein